MHNSTRKAPVTWILVADGHQATIYTRSATQKKIPADSTGVHPHFAEAAQGLIPVHSMHWKADSRAAYDAGTGSPSTVRESAGFERHGTEPHATISDEIKQHFTTKVAEALNRAWEGKSFSKLVLVAPPKMLGALRDQLDKGVLPHVVASLSKDLTHMAPGELMVHLKHIA